MTIEDILGANSQARYVATCTMGSLLGAYFAWQDWRDQGVVNSGVREKVGGATSALGGGLYSHIVAANQSQNPDGRELFFGGLFSGVSFLAVYKLTRYTLEKISQRKKIQGDHNETS